MAQVAAGAIEYLPMALVPGMPAALQRLSTTGVWSVRLGGDALPFHSDLPLEPEPLALVLGSEGTGLAALTRRRCDALASIPQHGTLSALNMAIAGHRMFRRRPPRRLRAPGTTSGCSSGQLGVPAREGVNVREWAWMATGQEVRPPPGVGFHEPCWALAARPERTGP